VVDGGCWKRHPRGWGAASWPARSPRSGWRPHTSGPRTPLATATPCSSIRSRTTSARRAKPDRNGERRTQIRFRRPGGAAEQLQPIRAQDVCSVDVNARLAVDPGRAFFVVGAGPAHRNADLPMGILDHYNRTTDTWRWRATIGWASWERKEARGKRPALAGMGLENAGGASGPPPASSTRALRGRRRPVLGPGSRPAAPAASPRGFRRAGRRRPHSLGGRHSASMPATIPRLSSRPTSVERRRTRGRGRAPLGRALGTMPPWPRRMPSTPDGQPDYELVLVDGRRPALECQDGSGGPVRQRRHKGRGAETRDLRSGPQGTHVDAVFDVVAAWPVLTPRAIGSPLPLDTGPQAWEARTPTRLRALHPGWTDLDSESRRAGGGGAGMMLGRSSMFKLSLGTEQRSIGRRKPRISEHRRINPFRDQARSRRSA